jgi:CBS-domain-containing membrane protein
MTDAAKAASPATSPSGLALKDMLLIALGVGIIGAAIDWLQLEHGFTHLAAPLAATLFGAIALPDAPASQPRAMFGGHIICVICSILVIQFVPWPAAHVLLCFAASIAAMQLLRVVHAPAVATIYFVAKGHADWSIIAAPFLPGLIAITLGAVLYHRLRGTTYPRNWF